MSALDQLESFLQGLMERPAGLLMPKGLNPQQLASALTKALEGAAVRLPDRILIPSHYRLAVSPEDYRRISAVQADLELELAEYVERVAAERDLSLPTDPKITIKPDRGLIPGQVSVAVAFPVVRAPAPAGPVPQDPAGSGGPALSLLSADGQSLRKYRLRTPSMTVGRRSSNDIALPDLKVSRKHARFDSVGDEWYVTDLRSTNGTRLNGSNIVQRSRLRGGDILELGLQRLRFDSN
jgi:hypothetical protein